MLRIERLTHKVTGEPLAGFFVRNAIGKAVAVGAFSSDGGFVTPTLKRYCRDVDLCRKIGELTGIPIKWNLTFWCRHFTSHNRQDLMRRVRRERKCK
jgi:hypothetical protein